MLLPEFLTLPLYLRIPLLGPVAKLGDSLRNHDSEPAAQVLTPYAWMHTGVETRSDLAELVRLSVYRSYRSFPSMSPNATQDPNTINTRTVTITALSGAPPHSELHMEPFCPTIKLRQSKGQLQNFPDHNSATARTLQKKLFSPWIEPHNLPVAAGFLHRLRKPCRRYRTL